MLDVDDLRQLVEKISRVGVPFVSADGQVKIDQLYSAVDPCFSNYSRFAEI